MTARGLAIVLCLGLLWASAGTGVYLYLGSHRSTVGHSAARPGESAAGADPALARLTGTLYLVQGGALYRLRAGRFTTVLGAGGWTQPKALPGDQGVVLVRRDPSGFSDLYRVDAGGQTHRLTNDQGKGAVQGIDPGGQLVTQYWAMYPQPSRDGSQLYFVTDRYKHVRCCPFDVTMRVAQMPAGGGTIRFWTTDAVTASDTHTEDGDYAGGDAQPVPVASGAVLFVRYAFSGNTIGSQLMLVKQARATPVALTAPADNCSQPVLSPRGDRLAIVCSYGGQMTSLEVAAFDGTSLGPRQIVVSGVQAAQPAWSPDGSQLVYVAPVGPSGHFQLWSTATPALLPTPFPTPVRQSTGRRSVTPSPVATTAPSTRANVPPPVQLTGNLDFDATSPIAWTA